MSRKRKTVNRKSADVDMTSMVDVTFLLLIFFMVTASFHLQKSIEVPSQQSDVGNPIDHKELANINVQVDQFGAFFVMTPDWELETPGKQNLIVALKQAQAESSDAAQMMVQVHESAKLKSLVDVLDAGASAGMASIQIRQFDHL
jgi:biopolymer transport protein ExbD